MVPVFFDMVDFTIGTYSSNDSQVLRDITESGISFVAVSALGDFCGIFEFCDMVVELKKWTAILKLQSTLYFIATHSLTALISVPSWLKNKPKFPWFRQKHLPSHHRLKF